MMIVLSGRSDGAWHSGSSVKLSDFARENFEIACRASFR
jgi:hypothetical protein